MHRKYKLNYFKIDFVLLDANSIRRIYIIQIEKYRKWVGRGRGLSDIGDIIK